jgi:hypothetical protein
LKAELQNPAGEAGACTYQSDERRIAENPAQCRRARILQQAINEPMMNSGFEDHHIKFSKNIPSYDDISASGF